MMINLENYEQYAIDYLEGNLDKETSSAMTRFLNSHQDIKTELNSMMDPVILNIDTTITFEPKSLLKKEEQKKTTWLPSFTKYAAAIALLLSISSVWYLNNSSATEGYEITAKTDKRENKKLNNNKNTKETGTEKNNNLNKNAVETSSYKNINQEINKNTEKKNSNPTTADQSEIKSIETEIKRTQITNTTTRTSKQIKKTNILESTIKESNNTVADASNELKTKLLTIPRTQPNEKEITAVKINRDSKRIKFSTKPIDLHAQADVTLSTGSIINEMTIAPPPSIDLENKTNKSKGSWILNAITKKSDGTNIFAFEGVRRALTPTRLRDVNTGSTSIDSPLKQFTND